MKVYNIIIIVLNTLVFLGLGLLLCGMAVSSSVADQLVGFHQALKALIDGSLSARLLIGLGGLGAVALSLSTIIGNAQNRRWERAVVFRNPMGDVMITLGALEDMGRQVKAEVHAVKDLKMRVKPRSGGIYVSARVTLWNGTPIPEATEQVQESIQRVFRDAMGIEGEVRPRVLVSKIAFRDPEEERRADELARARKRYPSSVV